jgi:hypothetical protein
MAHAIKLRAGLNPLTRRARSKMPLGAPLALCLYIAALLGSASAAAAPLQGVEIAAGNAALLTLIGHGNKNKQGKNWNKGNGKWGYNGKYGYHGGPHVQYWKRKPYYGDFIGGVVLGTILGVGVVGVAPPPPGPQFCWYWADPSMTRGYWDYCY